MVIKLDIVINNIMAKVVYFGKHISNKIRDANNVLINYNLLIVFVELIYLKFTLLTII